MQQREPRPNATSSTRHGLVLELGRCLWQFADLLKEAIPRLCIRATGHAAPPPRVVMSSRLKPGQYRLNCDSVRWSGKIYPNRLQAVVTSGTEISGKPCIDLTSGQPARWILQGARGKAMTSLQEPAEVLQSALEVTLRHHAGSQDTLARMREALTELQSTRPTLVQRTQRRLGDRNIIEVLRLLCLKSVVPPDLEWVLDRLAASPSATPAHYAERLREDLKSVISAPLVLAGRVRCLSLDAVVQRWLFCEFQRAGELNVGSPWIVGLFGAISGALEEFRTRGELPALLCIPSLRPGLGRLLRLFYPELTDARPDLPSIIDAIRRLLEFGPNAPLTDLALCLSVLDEGSYRRVAGHLFEGLGLDQAELLRGEVIGARRSDCSAATRAVSRFATFYRGDQTPILGDRLAPCAVQAAVLRDSPAMASCLERLSLPRGPILADFRRWCYTQPKRSANWLLRWSRCWAPSLADPTDWARAAYAALPDELAMMVKVHLTQEFLGRLHRHGAKINTNPLIFQGWLREYFHRAYRSGGLPSPGTN